MSFRLQRASVVLLITLLWLQAGLRAQEGELDKVPPKNITTEQVIQRFTAKEKEWKKAREQYTFRQTVKQQALDGESELGEYRQVADVSYQNGKRIRQIVFSPQAGVQMSKEDLDDLETRSSFTISSDELPEYDVLYIGRQKMDELHCFVFDVAPKRIEKDKRYFQGRIWVDDQDFQIVKNTGKSVPDIKIMKKKRLEENLRMASPIGLKYDGVAVRSELGAIVIGGRVRDAGDVAAIRVHQHDLTLRREGDA
jgi:hypothetical protein